MCGQVRDVILRMTTMKVSGGRRSMASTPGVLRTPSRVADSGSELESWTLSMGSDGAQKCGGRRSNKCLLLSREALRVARFALGPHLGRAVETRAVRCRKMLGTARSLENRVGQTVLIGLFLVEGILLAWADLRMKANLAPGVEPCSVRWAPIYWGRPELFTADGNRYRRIAIGSYAAGVVTFVAIVFLVSF